MLRKLLRKFKKTIDPQYDDFNYVLDFMTDTATLTILDPSIKDYEMLFE